MTRRKVSPTWWRHHAIVTRTGEVCFDFAYPSTHDAFVCAIGNVGIEPVKLRIRREFRAGREPRIRAYEVNGRNRRLCSLGLSYFETYEAARAFLIFAAEEELKRARASVKVALGNVAKCKKMPKAASTRGRR